MKNIQVNRISEDDRIANTRLLSSFELMFGSYHFKHILDVLHENGKFFGTMNRIKAGSYFYNLFFKEGGTSEKFHMEINRGITLDHIPGEPVLEFRCSVFDPFADEFERCKKPFGAPPDPTIKESVFRFAFSFKDELIYTIRIPGKCTHVIKPLIDNN